MSFFANLFGYLLNAIYNVVNNYGIAIIIFTIILKLIMLPISIRQQKTMKKSAKIQKEAREIQEKYSNDQLRQSQELMDLYKRENMSPFSGCLTSIVQLIVVLSMFFLVSKPLTYMKHIDEETISNYTTQIQEESTEQIRYAEIAIINKMSDADENVRLNMNFLGLDLSSIPSQDYENWNVFIIPVLYVLTSIFSTRLATHLNSNKEDEKKDVKENNKDKDLVVKENDDKDLDAMEEMNKQMMMITPIMTVMIALIAPLGLALYWLVSNLLNICERLIINKFFSKEEEKIG